MLSPSYCRSHAFETFREQLSQLESTGGLFRAAFAISLHERPDAKLTEVDEVLKRLSHTVTSRVRSSSTDALLAHLHDVLFDVYGLRGNTEDYYNPANSYLGDILQTRRGLPIALVLIYKLVAEPLGIRVYGINSPGHFLAEVEAGAQSGPMYIDPFFGGRLLTQSEAYRRIAQATGIETDESPVLLSRATHIQWLARMLTNLQASFSTAGEERNVYAMQELYALLPS